MKGKVLHTVHLLYSQVFIKRQIISLIMKTRLFYKDVCNF